MIKAIVKIIISQSTSTIILSLLINILRLSLIKRKGRSSKRTIVEKRDRILSRPKRDYTNLCSLIERMIRCSRSKLNTRLLNRYLLDRAPSTPSTNPSTHTNSLETTRLCSKTMKGN